MFNFLIIFILVLLVAMLLHLDRRLNWFIKVQLERNLRASKQQLLIVDNISKLVDLHNNSNPGYSLGKGLSDILHEIRLAEERSKAKGDN